MSGNLALIYASGAPGTTVTVVGSNFVDASAIDIAGSGLVTIDLIAPSEDEIIDDGDEFAIYNNITHTNDLVINIPADSIREFDFATILTGPGEGGEIVTNLGSYNHLLIDLNPSPPTCYRKGTRILTQNGEVAVERLQVGDCVVTFSGEAKPIKWVGRRRIDCRKHRCPESVWPVRIARDAVAAGVPSRELYVSPEHCLYFDGKLVPAYLLVNGATIAQTPTDHVDYYHVELDRHDVLVAESMAAESYLDCDNRRSFENAPDGVVTLHQDWRAVAGARAFASPATSARLRANLGKRARDLGLGAEIGAYESRLRKAMQVAAVNAVRNPRGHGARSGRIGEDGRAPFHWWLKAPEGVAIEIVAAEEGRGLPYIDLRLIGRSESGGECIIQPEVEMADARTGQDWTFSCFLALVEGGLEGLKRVNAYIDECGTSGAYLVGQDYLQHLPETEDLSLQRPSATRRLLRPDVMGARGYLQIIIEARAFIDVTLRMACPQFEQGGYASDPILPPPGEIRQAARRGVPEAEAVCFRALSPAG